MATATRTIETDIPARLDRLPWSRWHRTVLVGLGAVRILDGVEAARRSLEDVARPLSAEQAAA